MNSQGERRLQNELHGVPEMEMIGEHHVDILPVLPAKHRVEPPDLSPEERHAFVLDGRAIQRDEFETKKVGRLEKLGQDHFSIVRRVSRIVRSRAVFFLEKDKERPLF
jgi:hypothetical protein